MPELGVFLESSNRLDSELSRRETGSLFAASAPDLTLPIVLTGAMTPLGFEGSDGLRNLTESLLAAQLIPPGVYVVMHGSVIPANYARKDKTLGRFVRTD
jgi:L-asparaginase